MVCLCSNYQVYFNTTSCLCRIENKKIGKEDRRIWIYYHLQSGLASVGLLILDKSDGKGFPPLSMKLDLDPNPAYIKKHATP